MLNLVPGLLPATFMVKRSISVGTISKYRYILAIFKPIYREIIRRKLECLISNTNRFLVRYKYLYHYLDSSVPKDTIYLKLNPLLRFSNGFSNS
jgi:hypothetical protein